MTMRCGEDIADEGIEPEAILAEAMRRLAEMEEGVVEPLSLEQFLSALRPPRHEP
jgi:hypothetical protein